MTNVANAGVAASASHKLEEKYTLEHGQIYLSGTQALVRLPIMQKQSDMRAGLNTAGFISGYRGSPLSGYDQQLWQAQTYLDQHNIVFSPGVNEDLAATAVWGTQQVSLDPNAPYQGVFGLWYGKGPGVDRSTDVIKHANAAGTARHGGVVMITADDHAAKSSTLAHQSEHIMAAAGVPVFYPSNVQEFIDFGLHGFAMSRYAGVWAGLKCVTQVVETAATVEIDPQRVNIVLPTDIVLPEGGLNIRWPDPPLDQELRLLNHKCYAAQAYVRANKLNRIVVDSPDARFGIVTAGKAYQDVRQALHDLGLDDGVLRKIGLRIMKVACVWPLDAQDARQFAQGLEEILVVEEKRQLLEYALKEELYNWREDVRPKVYGKFDARGNAGGEWSIPRSDWLLPANGELSPALVAKAIGKRLLHFSLPEEIRKQVVHQLEMLAHKEKQGYRASEVIERKPWFCSGCPHNTSTKVPEGSRALAGIGCHYMAIWMDRKTETFSHMGGEGAAWIGQMHFSNDKHVFANLGDGTYFHSGILAIRAAVSANANITYKILFNDAIAMTGGQPVEGSLDVPTMVRQVIAEGVTKTVVVTDEPKNHHHGTDPHGLPDEVAIFHRDDLEQVQKNLRDTKGTTVLIYEQMCATEKRRRRKRGKYPESQIKAMINPLVCEGCGDCSDASNCLSIEPFETELGPKRRINQSSCNQDLSCIKGFCPSFVTVEGATLKKQAASSNEQQSADEQALNDELSGQAGGLEAIEIRGQFADLPEVALPALDETYRILVTGVGGTGVVTVGALLGMAAHLEDKGSSVLDITGLAQKGGAVLSHVQIAPNPNYLHATQIAIGGANLLIGCDGIVSATPDALSRTLLGVTKGVVNSSEIPTSSFIQDRNWSFPGRSVIDNVRRNIGDGCEFLQANALSLKLLGNTIYTNPLLLGYAWQKGWVPIGLASLLQAIEINGVQVQNNKDALNFGRYIAHHGDDVVKAILGQKVEINVAHHNESKARSAIDGGSSHLTEDPSIKGFGVDVTQEIDSLLQHRAHYLTQYQNEHYARRYLGAISPLKEKERAIANSRGRLTKAAAKNLAKLMAYKDEYEVARLHSSPELMNQLRAQFSGEPGKDYKLRFHLAPPILSSTEKDIRKRTYGSWMLGGFKVLSRLKMLRGGIFDIFGYSDERKTERQLVEDYLGLLEVIVDSISEKNYAERSDVAEALLSIPDQIRGYGHVKSKSIDDAKMRRQSLMEQLKAPLKRS